MLQYKNTKVKVSSPDGDTEYTDIVTGVYYLPLLRAWCFQAGKGKKKKIACAKNYGRRLRDDIGISNKYTCPNRIPAR